MRASAGLPPEEARLWDSYRTARDWHARECLLERYLPLVHHVARGVRRRIQRQVSHEDLVSAGMLGLIKAVEGFELTRGHQFSTYAVPRIRGAILDELRAIDWASRSVRANHRTLETAEQQLRGEGRAVTVAALAEVSGLAEGEVTAWQDNMARAHPTSLEGRPEEGGVDLREVLPDGNTPDPLRILIESERAAGLVQLLKGLPERERLVLLWRYYEDLSFRQIAAIMFVTESRVSQLHAQALRRLRSMMPTAS
jgi:RNA polymerase sigma factor for flagellar operon FliA